MTNKGVIFDMDGLMVGSGPTWARAEKSLLPEGVAYDKAIVKMYQGMGIRGVAETMVTEYARKGINLGLTVDEAEKRLREGIIHYFQDPSTPLELYEGCKELLASLQPLRQEGLRIGIASSSPREGIMAVLTRFHLEDFFDSEGIVSGEEIIHGKPAPDVYLESAKRLGVAPIESVVLEDAPKGIQAARSAGMATIAVTRDFHTPNDYLGLPTKIVRSLSEVNPNVIQSARGEWQRSRLEGQINRARIK